MRSIEAGRTLLVAATLLSTTAIAAAQEFTLSEGHQAARSTPYSPYVDDHFPQNA